MTLTVNAVVFRSVGVLGTWLLFVFHDRENFEQLFQNLFVSSADHLLPLLVFPLLQQTPRLQFFISVMYYFTDVVLLLFDGIQVFDAALWAQRCSVSCPANIPTEKNPCPT